MSNETAREFVLSQHNLSINPKNLGKRGRVQIKSSRMISEENLGIKKPWEVSGVQKITHYEAGRLSKGSNLTISVTELKRPLTEDEIKQAVDRESK